MGRTLVVAAALWTASAGTAVAQQPTPVPAPTPIPTPAPVPTTAPELVKQGQDAAARGDYATAIGAFTRALELEPNNRETKLALADAERQAGQCDKAIPRYKELLESASETEKETVKASLVQCPTAVVIEPPKQELPPPPVPPEPKIIEREGPPSLFTVGLIATAGACFGASIGMYLAGRGSESDADDARSYADHERISTRADRQKIAAAVLMGTALGLGGYALYRVKFKGKTTETEVALTPTNDGGAMIVRGSW